MKYVCSFCGYVYAEEAGVYEQGVLANTHWDDVPNGFVCPICGSEKELFSEEF